MGLLSSKQKALWGLFLLSLLLQTAYGFVAQPLNRAAEEASDRTASDSMVGDESHYYSIALNLLTKGDFAIDVPEGSRPTTMRPPVYPLALAGIFAVFGPSLELGVALNRLLVALTVFVVYGIASGLVLGETDPGGPSDSSTGSNSRSDPLRRRAHHAGLIAAFLTALWPQGLYFAGYLMTEAIAAFVYTLALLATIRMTRRPTKARAAWAGVAWTAVVLTRSVFVTHLLFLGPWLLLARRRIPRAVMACFLAAAAVSYSPWLIRNVVTFGEPIWITTAGGAVFHGAHTPETIASAPGSWSAPRISAEERALHPEVVTNELATDRYHWRQGLAVVRQLDARQVGRLVFYKLARMFVPAQWLVANRVCPSCNVAASALFLPVVGCSVLGLVLLRSRPLFFALVVSQIAALALTAVVFWGGMRLRSPMEPAFWAVAAFGVVAWLERKVWFPERMGLRLTP